MTFYPRGRRFCWCTEDLPEEDMGIDVRLVVQDVHREELFRVHVYRSPDEDLPPLDLEIGLVDGDPPLLPRDWPYHVPEGAESVVHEDVVRPQSIGSGRL